MMYRPIIESRHCSSGAKCQCGALLRFATDAIGRTVEQCDGCGYEGGVRMVRTSAPPPTRQEYFRQRHAAKRAAWRADPEKYSCGHPRTSENTYQHPRGWGECRQCGRDRNAASKARRKSA